MRIASQTMLALTRVGFLRACALALTICCCGVQDLASADSPSSEGVSSRDAKKQAIRAVPFNRLGNNGQKIKEVVEKPSFYRRMPTRQISCDPQMFTFLVRRPEVMVNIWDAMGITKVSARRLDPFSFLASDGVGTTCRCDLVYGDKNLHIYFGNGAYDGSMAPRKVTGRCVCILRSQTVVDESGHPIVSGTMDVFLKLDNLGADLLTRTLGPFVGKTADSNFVETAKFIAQISRVCENSITAAYGLATKLDKVDPAVRREFFEIASRIADADPNALATLGARPSAQKRPSVEPGSQSGAVDPIANRWQPVPRRQTNAEPSQHESALLRFSDVDVQTSAARGLDNQASSRGSAAGLRRPATRPATAQVESSSIPSSPADENSLRSPARENAVVSPSMWRPVRPTKAQVFMRR